SRFAPLTELRKPRSRRASALRTAARQRTACRRRQRTSSQPELRAKDGVHEVSVVAAAGTLVWCGQDRLDGRGTREDDAGQLVEGRRQVCRRVRETQLPAPRRARTGVVEDGVELVR